MEKHKIFLFQVFDFWFFKKIFILQQCLNPNFFSDSDSDLAKTFGLFRIRIHNTGLRPALLYDTLLILPFVSEPCWKHSRT
jgi:hypothetical protein